MCAVLHRLVLANVSIFNRYPVILIHWFLRELSAIMESKETVRIFKKRKSKTLQTKQLPPENNNHNKSLDFLNLYKSESETSAILAKTKQNVSLTYEDSKSAPPPARPGKVVKKSKKNETLELSLINSNGVNSNPAGMTSTPNAFKEKSCVKSIMKDASSVMHETVEDLAQDTPTAGPRKKRNKSVSFRLGDEQPTLVKKSKSEDTVDRTKGKSKNKKMDATSQHEQAENVKKVRTKPKKTKKSKEEEKENNVNSNVMDVSSSETPNTITDIVESKTAEYTANIPPLDKTEKSIKEKKKRAKNPKKDSNSASTDNIDKTSETKEAKSKKKKRHLKQNENPQGVDNANANGEPKTKNRKKEVKPEIIANDLENLKIGDNPHTLTNLLDDMKVAGKNKNKNSKNKAKKGKAAKTPTVPTTENGDLEKIEEGKEKVVWKKRKWNKDKKSDIVGEGLLTSVIVENLPVTIMPEYRKVLTEHFSKLGLIKNIGPAEVINNEDEVFTTTVMFYSEGAATEALKLTNTELEGATILVKRPLPPTETTIVIRSYGALTELALDAAFAPAGRIRSVKRLIKGKKSMATAFVEFDGPESAARALMLAKEARVGGKKIYVSRYEIRATQPSKPQTDKPAAEKEVKTPAGKPQSAGDATSAAQDDSSSDSSED